jgi:hypothetical protein
MVSCLLDRELDGPVFGNVLRLAAKLGSSLVFSSVKLGADGVIEVGFQAAPYPACDTEAALRANLAVVESFRSSYLNSLIGIRPRPHIDDLRRLSGSTAAERYRFTANLREALTELQRCGIVELWRVERTAVFVKCALRKTKIAIVATADRLRRR